MLGTEHDAGADRLVQQRPGAGQGARDVGAAAAPGRRCAAPRCAPSSAWSSPSPRCPQARGRSRRAAASTATPPRSPRCRRCTWPASPGWPGPARAAAGPGRSSPSAGRPGRWWRWPGIPGRTGCPRLLIPSSCRTGPLTSSREAVPVVLCQMPLPGVALLAQRVPRRDDQREVLRQAAGHDRVDRRQPHGDRAVELRHAQQDLVRDHGRPAPASRRAAPGRRGRRAARRSTPARSSARSPAGPRSLLDPEDVQHAG